MLSKVIKSVSIDGNFTSIDWLKAGLSILLLICLLPMPYGYYNLVRFIAMIVFGFLCYDYYNRKAEFLAIIFGCLAILFQPFAKIALGRTMWNIVDIAVALFLIVLLVKHFQTKTKDNESK